MDHIYTHYLIPFQHYLTASFSMSFATLVLIVVLVAVVALLLLLLIRKNGQQHQNSETIENLKKKISEYKVRQVRIITLLQTERKSSREKQQLLDKARQEIRDEFNSLAHDIFEERSEKFSSQSRERLETLLTPFHNQLELLKKEIQQTFLQDTRDRASLKSELMQLQQLNREITSETSQLTKALKGDQKMQGYWGELVLEKVLEQSGLRKGHEYDTQQGYRDNENKLFKPDVVINLPDNKNIIVDSKVSLVSWEKYINSEEPEKQQQHLKELTVAIRNHIKALGGKNYQDLQGLHCLDFVLMFMPIDAAFSAAFAHEEQLFDVSHKQRVIVVTPTTLLATLRTIENLWKFEQQNRNGMEIGRRASMLHDKFSGFVLELEKIGRQLNNCQQSYDSAINKLCKGRGNLIAQAKQLTELGVKVNKELPRSITDYAELDKLKPL